MSGISRRQFIKRGLGAVAVGVVMPKMLLAGSRSAAATSGSGRKLFVVVQLAGGNDGVNTVIPYTDQNYITQRPNLGFREAELVDASGKSTVLSDGFALHPAMTEIKGLFDQQRVAIVLGAGYPDPNLSHFLSMDIWHTADPSGLGAEGWLGRYADTALLGKTGLPAAAVGGVLPKTLLSPKVVIPSIISFSNYDFLTDPAYPGDSQNQLSTYQQNAARSLDPSSVAGAINQIGVNAVAGALQVQDAISKYTSSVVYPDDNPLAQGMKMLAEIIVTIPEANLLYVSMDGFDDHSDQIDHSGGTPARNSGQHAKTLGWFSQAVKYFYDDLAAHSLADNVLIMQWSEFGRRVNENESFGTDHGTAAPLFVIGNPVKGGLYGSQPSLAPADLDDAGNMKMTVDFRQVYTTILQGWLDADPNAILGGSFPTLGFL